MAKARQIKTAENLAETLGAGNFTENGQQIVAKNGDSFLDLRFSNTDNFIILANNSTGALGFLVINVDECVLGFDDSLGWKFSVSNTEAVIVGGGVDNYFFAETSRTGIESGLNGSSKGILLISNSSSSPTNTAGSGALFLNSGTDVEPSVFLMNKDNSVILGGKGITVKTSNTAYCNQISFQESGNLFDTLITAPTATADNSQALQDKSGTIALLSDTTLNKYVEKWTPYNATLNATWETITIVDAIENSLIEIICVNNNGDNDMGVRMVGSVLNRYVSSVKNSSLTMTVKTDSLKRIQVYASSFGQIDFFFSAQL